MQILTSVLLALTTVIAMPRALTLMEALHAHARLDLMEMEQLASLIQVWV